MAATNSRLTDPKWQKYFERKDEVFAACIRTGLWPAKTCPECQRRGYNGPAGSAACCRSYGHHRGDNCIHCGNDERKD